MVKCLSKNQQNGLNIYNMYMNYMKNYVLRNESFQRSFFIIS